jgi:hypothetical protein
MDGLTSNILGGFPSLNDLFNSLVSLRHPTQAIQAYNDTLPLGAWEVDFYLGQVGLGLLAVFGIYLPLRAARWKKDSPALQLLFASLVLALLSIGMIYGWLVELLHIPVLSSERVTSRMLILPIAMLSCLAVIQLQKWLNTRRFSLRVDALLLAAAGLMFHDLFRHLQVWRPRYLENLAGLFPVVVFDPANHTLANHADPVYVGLLLGGALVSLAALTFLITRAARQRVWLIRLPGAVTHFFAHHGVR